MPRTIPITLCIALASTAEAELSFNRDIRPVLSDRCFLCHGPDAKNQKSDLRLDTLEHATADLGGYAAIVPGNPKDSALLRRINHTDPDEVMPPPASRLSLTDKERATLAQWIGEGAAYQTHWSFTPPRRPPLPPLSAASRAWVRNGIDHFVAARLEKEGLPPSPAAPPEVLARRAALSLTGLLPEGDAAADPDARIEALLRSDHHAERMTLFWLDAARYADTDGFQNDSPRSNWPWRDWVIRAFRDNMPFDQFTIEQLAGDMLPGATDLQVLASAFNRNHRQNAEGGALAAEFYVENVIDRLETTSTVWLGLTMGCARCHDHKYDPISQREFYQLFAYFNNIGEKGNGRGVQANPILRTASPLQVAPAPLQAELEQARAAVAAAEAGLEDRAIAWAADAAGIDQHPTDDWFPAEVTKTTVPGGRLERQNDGSYFYTGPKKRGVEYRIALRATETPITGLRIDAIADKRLTAPRRLAPSVNGNFVLTGIEITANDRGEPATKIAIREARATFEQAKYGVAGALDNNPKTGWAVFQDRDSEGESALFLFDKPIKAGRRGTVTVTLRHDSEFVGHNIGRFRLQFTDRDQPGLEGATGIPRNVLAVITNTPATWSDADRAIVVEHLRGFDEPLRTARKTLHAAEQKLNRAGLAQVPVMVMRESPTPRPAFFLNRGQYDEPEGDPLPRRLPAALFPDAEHSPSNRLEFARWLVSPGNPLTARVVVNRIWQQHFGAGLVKTVEDFGSQGELPSHPDLLDWLAVEFVESGWDLRALHRTILASATWRQSARTTPALRARDPENRLLARGPRFRLDGFAIRDIALQASGLLNPAVGGPPVKPYQPKGLWNSVAGRANIQYQRDTGADLYRKSMYTYWKRAVNPPRQIIFDAGGRETCNVRLRATNTPLQALVLMNDETFLEAARKLAERMLRADDPLRAGYRLATGYEATEARLAVLRDSLAHYRQHFGNNPEDAEALLAIGESPRDESIPAPELSAATAVAHLLLNLDETITLE